MEFEKAFDKVQHTKLIEIVKQNKVDDKDIRIIKHLYRNQNARVKIGNKYTNRINIQGCVRQGGKFHWPEQQISNTPAITMR